MLSSVTDGITCCNPLLWCKGPILSLYYNPHNGRHRKGRVKIKSKSSHPVQIKGRSCMATACAGHQQASAKPGACCCWLTEREEAWRQGQGVKLDCAVLTAIRQKKGPAHQDWGPTTLRPQTCCLSSEQCACVTLPAHRRASSAVQIRAQTMNMRVWQGIQLCAGQGRPHHKAPAHELDAQPP